MGERFVVVVVMVVVVVLILCTGCQTVPMHRVEYGEVYNTAMGMSVVTGM